jgi:DNA polymerase I-like protein with 3'-5' exonuclease and polymerase domains
MKYILDIEADNLLDDMTTIHCVVLRDVDSDNTFSFYGEKIKECVHVIQNADQIIGHNLIGYDLPALKKVWGYEHQGDVLDTLVCSRTIWPHLMQLDAEKKKLPTKLWGSHSLKAWGYRLGELKGEYSETNNGAWEKFSQQMLDYCVQDTKVTQALYECIMAKAFSEDALTLEHNIASEMFKQEQRGFVFAVSDGQKLFAELSQRKNDIEVSLQSQFPPTVVQLKTKTKEIPFNPASRQQIAERLQTLGWKPEVFTESGIPKVDETVLSEIDLPEAKLLAEYLMLNKRIGQLGSGKQAWLKLEKEGKIHGRVNHMGAVTSRCTHSNPNVAQVPSVSAPYGRECRELFTVPDGYSLLGADASGLELRCLGHYMAPFDSGAYSREVVDGDIHTANQEAAGLPTRANAKTFIYGFLYGAGDEKIGQIINKGAKAGKAIKKKFLDKVPALKKLRDAVSEAAKRGWIKGLDGRQVPVRHPHAALNTLLQSAGAIICKRWYVQIEDDLRADGYTEEDVAIVAFVHDEVQIQVKQGLEDEVGKLVIRSMHTVEQIYNFNCPLDAEYSYGRNWAETH